MSIKLNENIYAVELINNNYPIINYFVSKNNLTDDENLRGFWFLTSNENNIEQQVENHLSANIHKFAF